MFFLELEMNHYLLIYDTAPDYLERRGQYRNEHLALAWAASDRGALVLGGALSDAENRYPNAVLMFRGDSPAAAEAFVAADPYVQHGLIRSWRVMRWHTVIGDGAAAPTGRPPA
jgi:uncharacterized protein YciI